MKSKEFKKDNIRLALAIRQLERSEVIHNSVDIWEGEVQSVLSDYGIGHQWNEDENKIITEYLLEMALHEEIREAERWAEIESDPARSFFPVLWSKH
jgi:hypothetical protein